MAAVVFLCREVLCAGIDGVSAIVRAKGSERLPAVLCVPETAALLRAMRGTARLMASLIYGGGLRVSECCELRVKDIDIAQALLTVRAGKGAKDRTTLLPESNREELHVQLTRCQALRAADRKAGIAGVWRKRSANRVLRSTANSAGRSRSEVPGRGAGARLLLGVPEPRAVDGLARGRRAPPSRERVGGAESDRREQRQHTVGDDPRPFGIRVLRHQGSGDGGREREAADSGGHADGRPVRRPAARKGEDRHDGDEQRQ